MLLRITRAAVVLAFLASLLVSLDLVRQVVATSAERIRTQDPTDFQGAIVGDHALRVRDGLPVYVEPDATFCPLLYTPLYYWMCAAVMGVAGPDLAACRLTSVILLGAAILLLALFVGRVTRSPLAAVAVLPVVLAGYAGCGFYYDAPRVDTASSLLVVAAVLTAAIGKRARGGFAVGALLAAAFFAKQSTPAFALPFLAVLLLRGRAFALAAAGTYLTLVAGGVGLATALSDGWFWRICMTMPAEHDVPAGRIGALFGADWLGRLRGFSLLTVVVTWTLARRWRGTDGDRTLRFLLLSFAAVLVMTTLAHARDGGTAKTLIPACVLLGAIVPVGLWRMLQGLDGARRDAATLAAIALFGLLVWEGRFAPEDALLPPEVMKGWDQLAGALEPYAETGEVWAALSGWPRFPGRPMRPGEIALNDYLREDRPLPPDLAEAVSSHAFTAIVLQDRLTRTGKEDRSSRLARFVGEHYHVTKRVNVLAGPERKRLTAGIYVPDD